MVAAGCSRAESATRRSRRCAREPNRTELPRLWQVPRAFPKALCTDCRDRNSKPDDPGTAVLGPGGCSAVRAAVGKALARPGAGARRRSRPPEPRAERHQSADATTAPAANATQPVRAVVETAKTVVKEVKRAAQPRLPSRSRCRRRLVSRPCRRCRRSASACSAAAPVATSAAALWLRGLRQAHLRQPQAR